MKGVMAAIGLPLVAFALVACGGSGGEGVGNSGGNGTAVDIDLSKAIAEGKVIGYDASKNGTPQVKENYLAVLNYMRSLSITCNDSDGVSGPSDPLDWNDDLETAAKEHSDDMLATGHYSHTGSGTATDIVAQNLGLSGGSSIQQRITHYKTDAQITGENIARLQSTDPIENDAWIATMEGWLESKKGHCSNIMHKSFKYFGMAEAKSNSQDGDGFYKAYWTQNFSD